MIVDTSDLGIEGVLKVLTDTVAASSERIVRKCAIARKMPPKTPFPGCATPRFPHMAGDGSISMVDVGSKNITRRVAIVRGAVEMNAHTLGLLKEHAPAQGRRAGHGAGRRDYGGEADFGAHPVVPSRAAEFCGRAF